MKQSGLTAIANIRQGREKDLREVLARINQDHVNNGLIDFTALTTVHYASWLILPQLPDKPARLLLETNYDGDLDAHLNQLLALGAPAFDKIYANCDGYPVEGARHSLEQVKRFLVARQLPSSAYYIAFPGRGVAEIRKSIAVYQEAQRFINRDLRGPFSYVDPNGRQQTIPSGFESLTPRQVQDSLTRHFRSSATSLRPDPAAPRHLLRLAFNWIAALGRGIPEALILAVLACFCERSEARNQSDQSNDPTRHPTDFQTYFDLDTGLQNHLCTLKTVKRSRLREFILRRVLSIVDFTARKIFIFSRLGQLSTIHFAKWMLIDGDGPAGSDNRLLFQSNYDGSFGSYLGDFSELAWYGLNPIWSNTMGFPPTTLLFFGGATDLVEFEKTDREHFYPAQVFYGAYSDSPVRKDDFPVRKIGYPVRNIRRYLEFSDDLARNIAAAERKERRRWRAVERVQRRSNSGKRTVDRRDLQGIVASGYSHFEHARYIFLEILDPARARRWLAGIVDQVSTAQRRERFEPVPNTYLNIAFTSGGLKVIDLPAETLDEFPYEFLAGMNRAEAAWILGDTGTSAREHWQFGNSDSTGHNPLHMMILLFAKSTEDLDDLQRKVLDSPSVFNQIARINTDSRDRKEPFGFRDGISQPEVMSLTNRAPEQIDEVLLPGEFVLGYQNEHNQIARPPGVARALDRKNVLVPDDKNPKTHKAFGMNGSYLVARKLSQNVAGFWQFVETQSAMPDGRPDPERRERLAAKLMGRWRSGAPLLLTQDRDVPIYGKAEFNNDFRYNKTDPDGMRCPIGSHIRRSNPRDDLKLAKPTLFRIRSIRLKSLTLSKRHRIIRRGRKYRELSEDLMLDDSKYDEGILFIAINADIHRQFEFVQQSWLNNPTFQGFDNDRDPIVGDNDGSAGFTIQNNLGGQRINVLQRFVTVKGGGYFFLPGISALRFLANQDVPATTSGDATGNWKSS